MLRRMPAEARRLDPSVTLSANRKDISSLTVGYKEYFESKVVPAWRKAGLPE
jgi:hypothetical protein